MVGQLRPGLCKVGEKLGEHDETSIVVTGVQSLSEIVAGAICQEVDDSSSIRPFAFWFWKIRWSLSAKTHRC